MARPRTISSIARDSPLSGRLEQLDGISVGILELDLLAARSGLEVVPKPKASSFQNLDAGGQIAHSQHDAVPRAVFFISVAAAIRGSPFSPSFDGVGR
jgi:hypothetical protein